MSDLAKSSGEAFGLYGKAGGRAGPVKGGLGFNGGFQMVPHLFQQTHMGLVSPKVSFTNQGTGLSATAAAEGEFAFYGHGK